MAEWTIRFKTQSPAKRYRCGAEHERKEHCKWFGTEAKAIDAAHAAEGVMAIWDDKTDEIVVLICNGIEYRPH